MPGKIEKIFALVLERVTPSKEKRKEIMALAERLQEKVLSACKEFRAECSVRVEGSVAKDTWLSREPDIDIFMRVPTTIAHRSLGDICLKIARKATEGSRQIERFAEHPYLEAIVESTPVNIVPCYDVKRGEWLSSTDRTPFHTDYVKENLKEHMKGEVRLLKKFMKGIDVYGAEIKVGGFSGYLCELLTLHFETFLNTLKAFAQLKRGMSIDIENHYPQNREELELLFEEPLVVVDPIDKGRNVASAVQPQKLYTLIAAARAFLKNPDAKYFYPPKTAALSVKQLERELVNRGSEMVFLILGKVDAVPDVLWGQLYKSQRSLAKQIGLNGFSILRDVTWSDEDSVNVFIFELEQRSIPSVKKHWGPPLQKRDDCEKFLQKYTENPDTVSGPFIEDGRWVVQICREYTDVVELLRDKLKDGGRRIGVAEKMSKTIRKKEFKILVNHEIADFYQKNRNFARFLIEFLSGKPRWLRKL